MRKDNDIARREGQPAFIVDHAQLAHCVVNDVYVRVSGRELQRLSGLHDIVANNAASHTGEIEYIEKDVPSKAFARQRYIALPLRVSACRHHFSRFSHGKWGFQAQ
jgi:hypothetical protein